MPNLILGLIGLSALGFLLAVVAVLFTGPIMNVSADGYSQACTNLALIAIALDMVGKRRPSAA